MKKDQRGAVVIIEATFVFPIMFFVIFIMLMSCEAYYQYARVESACMTAAIRGAARCENPMLEEVQNTGKVPTSPSAVKVRPYRYIFTSEAKNIAGQLEKELRNQINGMNSLAFNGIKPSNVHVTVTPKMNIFVSSFQVDCSFQIKLPIRMIFSNDDLAYKYSISMSEPVGDPAEFIRNVSTVQDYLERSEFGEKIENFTAKIKEALGKIARFTN